MQDEACTTYGGDIDQMTLGHQFIYNTFGAVPTKGWQIGNFTLFYFYFILFIFFTSDVALDPFGQSSVTPTLNKLSGFDAHVINRVTNKVSSISIQ